VLILVAVDGSDAAARAVRWTADHAAQLKADVVAVHAIEEPVYAVPLAMAVAMQPLSPEARAEVQATLERDWCAPLADRGLSFKALLLDGPPASAIIRAAKELSAELVVVGRRGRGGFAELLLGSVSHQLAHHVGRPLVIVP
jgi:nucleotide-binding universal stress UspA family protein